MNEFLYICSFTWNRIPTKWGEDRVSDMSRLRAYTLPYLESKLLQTAKKWSNYGTLLCAAIYQRSLHYLCVKFYDEKDGVLFKDQKTLGWWSPEGPVTFLGYHVLVELWRKINNTQQKNGQLWWICLSDSYWFGSQQIASYALNDPVSKL